MVSIDHILSSNYSWTPELAYIVGLMATDGNLSKDRRHITFCSSDLDLLVTVESILNTGNKIIISRSNGYAKKQNYRLQFSNVEFYRWLLTIGIFPNKTHTISRILVPDKFFIDFLRGHLDGDGTVMTYEDRYGVYKNHTYVNQRVYVKFISASKEHILWLYSTIHRILDVNGSITCNTPVNNQIPIWTIKFAKKESLKLLPLIYYKNDLPCLKRKYAITQSILHHTNMQKRKDYMKVI